ncbi:MAG: TonB-dependent receptor domain-containing protein [Acidobacteriota bacterium]
MDPWDNPGRQGRSRRPDPPVLLFVRVPACIRVGLLLLASSAFQPLVGARRLPAGRGETALSPAREGAGRPQDNLDFQGLELVVTVRDENGVALPSVHLILAKVGAKEGFQGRTGYRGQYRFSHLTPGRYRFRAQKEGFYATAIESLRLVVGGAGRLEVTLNHERELVEAVDVTYSPPSIDPTETERKEQLGSEDIIDLPYPTTRDIRTALPFMPGVVQDALGQVHLNGAAGAQVLHQLDGFNITHPLSGQLGFRLSPDALRSIATQSSRYSVEYGKGSGGTLDFLTAMGEDHYRFSATNFVPSLQNRKGLHLNEWTPRATFSGPLRRGSAWFFDAVAGEYALNIIDELPRGEDQSRVKRVNNLAKVQVNWNPSNILTGSLLTNHLHSDHSGLSRFNPLKTTREASQTGYVLTLKNQSRLANGMLFEAGFALSHFRDQERPLGRRLYTVSPEGTSGNFFKHSKEWARRLQWIVTLTLPDFQWKGHHQLKLGTDLDRITSRRSVERRPILIQGRGGTPLREISFNTPSEWSRNNFEVSAFLQDRWSLSDRLLLEPGLRLDRDEIAGSLLFSPRLASTYLLRADGSSKLSAGIGLFYDATDLDLLGAGGERQDRFLTPPGGQARGRSLLTTFRVNEQGLKAPRFVNWSIGMEHRFPAAIYVKAGFVQRRGRHGVAFFKSRSSLPGAGNVFELRNDRRDRYDAFQLSARRIFKGRYRVFASYVRSAARSNAVLDFDIDQLLFSPQAGGPFSWDAPNRLISWGWLPLLKGFNLGYSLEWRSGFPFSVVNQNQELVEPPNSRRFPTYFSLNAHIERRFRLLGFKWALRAGFNNVTNRQNGRAVNNNIDSPRFLTFAAIQGRAFTGRIRFLGRK